MKNPFAFELATVVVNDSVTREAITRDQMRKFLKFVHDNRVYCKYYEAVYILFHTGMRISEFCGLTISDIDLKNNTVNIERQLLRTSRSEYYIETTKTNAGTRVIPITREVAEMFRSILADRPRNKIEKAVQGHTGFLYLDKNGMPLVAMHWENRLRHMVHSDISVTMNVYTHVNLEDAENELHKMQKLIKAKEVMGVSKKVLKKNMFRVV